MQFISCQWHRRFHHGEHRQSNGPFVAWQSSSNIGVYGAVGTSSLGMGSGGLGGGNNDCGAGRKGTGVTNNTIGNNNLLLIWVGFETSLITGDYPRRSDVFNGIVVELYNEKYCMDT